MAFHLTIEVELWTISHNFNIPGNVEVDFSRSYMQNIFTQITVLIYFNSTTNFFQGICCQIIDLFMMQEENLGLGSWVSYVYVFAPTFKDLQS